MDCHIRRVRKLKAKQVAILLGMIEKKPWYKFQGRVTIEQRTQLSGEPGPYRYYLCHGKASDKRMCLLTRKMARDIVDAPNNADVKIYIDDTVYMGHGHIVTEYGLVHVSWDEKL